MRPRYERRANMSHNSAFSYQTRNKSPMKNPRLNTIHQNLRPSINRRLIPILPHPLPRPNPPLLNTPFHKKPLPPKQRTIQRPQIPMIPWPNKVLNPQPVNMSLVRRRRNDAVHATLQEPVCPELQHVRHVNDYCRFAASHISTRRRAF